MPTDRKPFPPLPKPTDEELAKLAKLAEWKATGKLSTAIKSATSWAEKQKRYGVDVRQIWLDQGSCCAVCKSTAQGKRWEVNRRVDGSVRGVVCSICSGMLRMISNDIARARSAIAYLEDHNHTADTTPQTD